MFSESCSEDSINFIQKVSFREVEKLGTLNRNKQLTFGYFDMDQTSEQTAKCSQIFDRSHFHDGSIRGDQVLVDIEKHKTFGPSDMDTLRIECIKVPKDFQIYLYTPLNETLSADDAYTMNNKLLAYEHVQPTYIFNEDDFCPEIYLSYHRESVISTKLD